jgi:hypothetical protein
LGFIISRIRYEAKATGAAGFAIAHDDRVEDLAVTAEEVAERFIGRRPCKISDVDFGHFQRGDEG